MLCFLYGPGEPGRYPPLKMRFTITSLFLLVFAIAMLLAGLFAVERGYRPDPASEAFFVLGDQHTPQWTKCDPTPNKSGIQSKPLALEQNYRGSNNVKHRQKLFEYRYNDRFGNHTFDVTYDIDAHFDDDWNEYLFTPIVSGGGNTGANANIETLLDKSKKSITVIVHQGFRSLELAKKCRLEFTWNGSRFELRSGG